MDKMPEKLDSKFRFVLLAANRAEQLMRGARPNMLEMQGEKETVLAMAEVHNDMVEWDYGPAPVSEVEEPAAEEVAAEEVAEAT